MEAQLLETESGSHKPLVAARREWTVLIYLAGDNNLSEECVYILKEIKRVAPPAPPKGGRSPETSSVHVVAQFDPLGRGNPSRRFHIEYSDGELEDDELYYSRKLETDTGSPSALLEFLLETIEWYPARQYMLVLSGHGAGVLQNFFLQDEERPLSSIPSTFPVPALRRVFRSARLKHALGDYKIDILGFDACMMSMTEVCYQLRDIDVLNLVVGSEGFSLNSGWPMDRILGYLQSLPPAPPATKTSVTTVAKKIVDIFTNFYHDYYLGGLSVDQSVIDLSKIGKLRDEIDRLALAMLKAMHTESPKPDRYDEKGRPFQDALLLAHWAAQSYNGEQCVDLYDFCNLLQKRVREDRREESVWSCCKRIMEFLTEGDDRIIKRSCYAGAAFQHSHGISIYFPWGDYDVTPGYNELDFYDHSKWDEFLKRYLKVTKRVPE